MDQLVDDQGRRYRKLRISVTDRCQFRCTYCMPEGPAGGAWLPKDALLSFEEITHFTRLATDFGVDEVRLSGGEPLLRRDLHVLVAQLARLPRIKKLALTSNGVLLPDRLPALIDAGLDSITISIDSQEPDTFKRLAGGGELAQVRAGIDALSASALPGKLNAVVIRGENDNELPDLIRFGHAHGLEMRFIEYMPFGAPWGWDAVVTQAEILAVLEKHFGALIPVEVPYGNTSRRWKVPALDDYVFGIIPTMGETLCAECDRLRLTADGRVLNCLFDTKGISIRETLRSGHDAAVSQLVSDYFAHKGIGYLAQQNKQFVPMSHMHRVGG